MTDVGAEHHFRQANLRIGRNKKCGQITAGPCNWYGATDLSGCLPTFDIIYQIPQLLGQLGFATPRSIGGDLQGN
jgi:hypothetical protein